MIPLRGKGIDDTCRDNLTLEGWHIIAGGFNRRYGIIFKKSPGRTTQNTRHSNRLIYATRKCPKYGYHAVLSGLKHGCCLTGG